MLLKFIEIGIRRDLMNWKDIIISSVKWALSVSIMIFSGTMVMYGTFILAAGVFKGIIGYIVLGPILFMMGLTVIHLMETLSGYHIDSNVDDKDIEA